MGGNGELLPTERATIFKTVFAKVLFPALGQEAFIDDTAFGMRVIWNFNGNINKVMRMRQDLSFDPFPTCQASSVSPSFIRRIIRE